MEKRKRSDHISEEELVQLVLDELPFAREADVLGHIAECDECAALSRQLHSLSETLEEMAPAGALIHRVAAAVRSVMGWAPRVAKVAEDLAALALGGVVAEPALAGSRLAFMNLPAGSGGLPPMLGEGAGPGGAAVRTRGAIRTRAATDSPIRPQGAVPARGRVRARVGAPAAVEFDDSPAGLEVRLTSWPEDRTPPTLAVVPKDGAPFRAGWEASGGIWRATIDKPAGSFVIIFCGTVPPAR